MSTWKNYFTGLFRHNSLRLMQECTLPYIPQRLHSFGKAIVSDFSIGEELYYRCNIEESTKPYQKLSKLYDISHNRNFGNSAGFPKDDVLFDIDTLTSREIIPDKHINVSTIKTLSKNNTFEKSIQSEDDPSIVLSIKLLHDPLPCMYSHCVFEISLNEVIITDVNFTATLGRNNKLNKNLRRDIRQELTSIIYSNIIDSDSETEIITNL